MNYRAKYHFIRQVPAPVTPSRARSRLQWRNLLCNLVICLAGAALILSLPHAPLANATSLPAFNLTPVLGNARINGTECDLVDAITAANTDDTAGICAAGTSGADTIELLSNVLLTAANNGDNGLPVITSAITINGNGFTIARDANVPAFRILTVDATGALTLTATTLTGGNATDGGGIHNAGMLNLSNSTLNSNTAANGGAISNAGTLNLSNSTLSGNRATTYGGAIYNTGTLSLTNSTLSGNTGNSAGGGIFNYRSATLARSLIAGNGAVTGAEIANLGNGPIVSDNYNLFGHSGETNTQALYGFTPGGSDILATSGSTRATALTSILDTTLANNGGGTFTHALVPGSPAVDAAQDGPTTDQRGVARPQGAAYDIGAFEVEQIPPTNTPVPPTPTSTPTPAPPTSTPRSPTRTPTPVNHPPAANNDQYATNEDTPLAIGAPGVLGNDSDVNPGTLLHAVLVTGPSYGALTLNADGSFTYTPQANFNGSDTFTYTANDGALNSAAATVTLTVNAVNDAPTLTTSGGRCLSDTKAQGSLTLTVGDAETAAESLTVSATADNTVLIPNNSLVFSGSGAVRTLTVTAANNKSGTATITITVSDGLLTSQLLALVSVGDGQANTLTGAAGPDLLFGMGGKDVLLGLAGNDLMCGGRGDDTLTGGDGADVFSGGSGADSAADFTPSQGDTQDGTVEGAALTGMTSGEAAPLADEEQQEQTKTLFLPLVMQ